MKTKSANIQDGGRTTLTMWTFKNGKQPEYFEVDASFYQVGASEFEKLPGTPNTNEDGTVIWKDFTAKTQDGIKIEITAFLKKPPFD